MPQLTSGSSNRRRRRQGGNIMIMFTMMLPFVLIPLVGLAIDETMMYIVKAKLQTAVDGASLAAAQSLSAGLDLSSQAAAATLAADQFIRANMTAGGHGAFWGAYNLNDQNCTVANGKATPSGTGSQITYTNLGNCIYVTQDDTNKLRSVSLVASVQVPLLFMRVLGFSSGTVASSATASRRDVVLVLVIDRSSSMNNVIDGTPVLTTLQEAATGNFVDKFQSGRDKLGLVAFGGSAIVAYPIQDWNRGAANPIGPQNTFATDTPNMDTLINTITIGSNTGTAEALSLAYQEIVATNEPGALNVIVLFTDGQPNGISGNFNINTANNAVRTAAYDPPASPCNYPSEPANNALSMIGWIAQWGGYAAGNNNAHGIYRLAQYDNTQANSPSAWLTIGQENVIPFSAGQPAHGCSYQGTGTDTQAHINANAGNVGTDVALPAVDYYGNATQGVVAAIPGVGSGSYTQTDYKQSAIWTNADKCNSNNTYGGNPISLTAHNTDSCEIGLASWNAADMAARTIHQDAHGLKPIIYALGFQGNGGDDPAFMMRLANCQPGAACGTVASATNTAYWSGQPSGMYVSIQVPADIGSALQTVLAQVLRLSM
jgi:Flp pilus assembly protein TadG